MSKELEMNLADLKVICERVSKYPETEREEFRRKADMEVMMINPIPFGEEIKSPIRHEDSGLADSLKKVIYGEDYKHLTK